MACTIGRSFTTPHHALHTAMMAMMMAATHPLHTTTPRHASPQRSAAQADRGGLTRPGTAHERSHSKSLKHKPVAALGGSKLA